LKKNKDGVKKKRSFADVFRSSMIIKGLGGLSSLIYRGIRSGIFGGMLTSYGKVTSAVSRSMTATELERLDIRSRVILPFKLKLAGWSEESVIVRLLRRLFFGLLALPMKTYGVFLFSYAFYSALIYLFKLFYYTDADKLQPDLGYIGVLSVMLISSVAMIASKHYLAGALKSGPASRFLLFRVAGLRTNCLDHINAGVGKYLFAFFFGLLFGFSSFIIHPLTVIAATVLAGVLCLVFIKPEFGLLAIMTALPFLPTMVLVAAVLFVALSYIIKVMLGKRTLKLDLMDIVVALFALLMVFGGLVSADSASVAPMLVYVAFLLGYFLCVNLIRNTEWVDKCVAGIVISSVPVSLYGLYQNFFGVTSAKWLDKNMFGSIEGRVVSTFENPNVLAEYLIMLIPLLLALVILADTKRTRFAVFLALVFSLGCLVYTWSRGAWLGFMLGAAIFLLMYSKKTLMVLIPGALAAPLVLLVLPRDNSIVQRFMSIGNMADSSTSYRVNIWRGVCDLVSDFWAGGIGIGYEPFRRVYPTYSLEAIEAAPHSHNLFLQILVEIGIVGLIVFLAAMFVYSKRTLSVFVSESRNRKLIPAALFCGTLSVLAQGMTDYIWYNYRVYLMFWLLIGLGAAALKNLENSGNGETL